MTTNKDNRLEEILRVALQLKATGATFDTIINSLLEQGFSTDEIAPVVSALFQTEEQQERKNKLSGLIGGIVAIVFGIFLLAIDRQIGGIFAIGVGTISTLVSTIMLLHGTLKGEQNKTKRKRFAFAAATVMGVVLLTVCILQWRKAHTNSVFQAMWTEYYKGLNETEHIFSAESTSALDFVTLPTAAMQFTDSSDRSGNTQVYFTRDSKWHPSFSEGWLHEIFEPDQTGKPTDSSHEIWKRWFVNNCPQVQYIVVVKSLDYPNQGASGPYSFTFDVALFDFKNQKMLHHTRIFCPPNGANQIKEHDDLSKFGRKLLFAHMKDTLKISVHRESANLDE